MPYNVSDRTGFDRTNDGSQKVRPEALHVHQVHNSKRSGQKQRESSDNRFNSRARDQELTGVRPDLQRQSSCYRGRGFGDEVESRRAPGWARKRYPRRCQERNREERVQESNQGVGCYQLAKEQWCYAHP